MVKETKSREKRERKKEMTGEDRRMFAHKNEDTEKKRKELRFFLLWTLKKKY